MDCKGCVYDNSRKRSTGKCLVYIEKEIATMIKGRKIKNSGDENIMKPFMTSENKMS